jgi:hypothetical protein
MISRQAGCGSTRCLKCKHQKPRIRSKGPEKRSGLARPVWTDISSPPAIAGRTFSILTGPFTWSRTIHLATQTAGPPFRTVPRTAPPPLQHPNPPKSASSFSWISMISIPVRRETFKRLAADAEGGAGAFTTETCCPRHVFILSSSSFVRSGLPGFPETLRYALNANWVRSNTNNLEPQDIHYPPMATHHEGGGNEISLRLSVTRRGVARRLIREEGAAGATSMLERSGKLTWSIVIRCTLEVQCSVPLQCQ